MLMYCSTYLLCMIFRKKKFPLHNDDVPIENNICTETSKNEITRI